MYGFIIFVAISRTGQALQDNGQQAGALLPDPEVDAEFRVRIGCRDRGIYGRRACLRGPVEGDSSRTRLYKIYARGVSDMAQELGQTMTTIAGRTGPIFSGYLSVNADIPENQRRAYLVRLRDAMNDEGVPEGLQERVREFVEEETHPGAKTLAIFTDEDDLFEVHRLHIDMPEAFRWGDPYVAPLALVLDEYEPYGAAVIDAERVRYFVVSPLGDAGEGRQMKANGFLEVDVHPDVSPPSGGTDHDAASRRTEAHIRRFYNDLGKRIRDISFQEGVQRLILAGPRERTAEFRRALPNELQERVVAEEHLDLGSPEDEILDRLEAVRER